MLGDPDEDEDVLAFGSTRRPISRRVKRFIAAGGVVAVAAITCTALALGGAHSGGDAGNLTTTAVQQDNAAQSQAPWSLDLTPGTVAHIARAGSGGAVPTGSVYPGVRDCWKAKVP